ncbi:MAG: Co2+/Mg2+ efflux protein ApaG [Alphaproteobacteria bacterium]|nr:Co2+/Mg2+ efflux protein ApaG [Alphaproteobacteria bacterium]
MPEDRKVVPFRKPGARPPPPPTFHEVTDGIAVSVRPFFLPDQSTPSEGQYLWAYWVRIENQGAAPARLVSRYWKITDGMGRVQEVRGAGVVGEQPHLKPGQSFEYTSSTGLPTASGFMGGSYTMQADDGRRFEVTVPTFSLDAPGAPRSVN